MNDLISRAEAIELKPEFLNPNVNRETKEQTAIDRAYARGWNSCNTHWIKEIVEDLPSAQPDLSDDGTLMMTVPHGILSDVKRVMVDEVGTKNCKVMYQDEPQPEQECEKCIFKPFKQFQPERR